MRKNKGKLIHINEFGLCEVASLKGRRFAFTLDKLPGYVGQPLSDFGLRIGAEVIFESDELGRVESAQVSRAATTGS